MILLFKIRDASGERKYFITASDLTELTFSKDVLLKCSLIRFIQYYSIVFLDFFPQGGGFFDTFDWPFVFHPGEFDQKIFKFVKSPPLACTPPPPTGFTLIGALSIISSSYVHLIFAVLSTRDDKIVDRIPVNFQHNPIMRLPLQQQKRNTIAHLCLL